MIRRPQQSGFTAGRATIDALLVLRQLSEIHREFDRPLQVAYLDIKPALTRLTLRKAIRIKGVPYLCPRDLIEPLHHSTDRPIARTLPPKRCSIALQSIQGDTV